MIAFLRRYTVDAWREIDREWREAAIAKAASGNADANWGRAAWILVVATLVLFVQQYFGTTAFYFKYLHKQLIEVPPAYAQLASFAWWAFWRVLGYVVIPLLVIRYVLKESPKDYYLGIAGLKGHIGLYLLLLLIVAPFVWGAAQHAEFRSTYPFYKQAGRSIEDFLMWEAMYALQFFGVEFFFRAFLTRGLAPIAGAASIFIALVPYCMIHFPKPMPEAFGSIITGIVLATIAMRTKTIWGGVFVHVAVAVAMDAMSILAARQ